MLKARAPVSIGRFLSLALIIYLLIVGVVSIVNIARGESVETTSLMIISRGLKWLGESSRVLIMIRVGSVVNSTSLEVNRGFIVEWSFLVTKVSTPAPFSITIVEDLRGNVFILEGEISRSSVKVTRVFYDEERITPHGDVLLEISFIGWFYSIDLHIPIKAKDINVEAQVDGSPVQAEIVQQPDGIKVSIQGVVFITETSLFEVVIRSQDHSIAIIRGVVSPAGLKEISMLGGVLETITARASVTNGTRKAFVPTSILGLRFTAEESVQIIRVTEVYVSSAEIIRGNVPVRLVAYRRGLFLEPSRLIDNAKFEVTLTSLNVTKVYENNSTAYLPLNEEIVVRAHAPRYKSQEQVIVITNETREVVFYLEEEQPSPLQTLGEVIHGIITHRLFVPIMLGIIAGLLVVAIIRRG